MAADPAKLHIREFPDPTLRTRSHEVDAASEEVRAVALRMIDLMHEAPGGGLAANQVGLDWRLFVVDVMADVEKEDAFRSLAVDPPSATNGPQVYVNPKLGDFSRDLVPYTEGCLSLPGIEGEVRRPSQVTISAVNLDGEPFSLRADGLLARVWQHEFDHLEGVLILDRMIQADRKRNQRAIRDLEASAPGIRQ
jgi:peptide deformylase